MLYHADGLAFWFGSKLIADDRQEVLDQVPPSCPPALDYATICTADWLQGAPAECATWCNPTVMDCVFGETCHTGGDVVLVFFSVIIGAMAIGQVGGRVVCAPCPSSICMSLTPHNVGRQHQA